MKDAQCTNEFYKKLGFAPNEPNNDPKLASFILGENDFVILFSEHSSQIDEYFSSDPKNNSEIIFTLSAETEDEVKEWAETKQITIVLPLLILMVIRLMYC